MGQYAGVLKAKKKDGTTYYRASITYKKKHISLGSFREEKDANLAYQEADKILHTNKIGIEQYKKGGKLSFEKWVILINFRDNEIYCKTPIYILSNYFIYYFSLEEILKFDVDDLFYYSKHTIQRRGGHLFVSEYGMQVNILSRYGIKNFAVVDRDYRFVNGDSTDFRYRNIEIINKYHGVTKIEEKGMYFYRAKIHVNGDYIVGNYSLETEAAVAYNKAANILKEKGVKKEFPHNFVVELDEIEYSAMYNRIRISKKIKEYKENKEEGKVSNPKEFF